MSGRVEVPDTSIRAMLRRRSARTEPFGLAATVFKAIDEAPPPRRVRVPHFGLPPLPMPWPALGRFAPVIVAAALLLAALAGALAGAQVLRVFTEPLPSITDRWTTAPDRWVLATLPEPPAGLAVSSARIAPVSADEVWVSDGEALWHYADGAWSGPFTDGLPALTQRGVARLGEIAAAPDGSVWGIAASGLARLHDGSWDVVVPGAIHTYDPDPWIPAVTDTFFSSIAVDHDGTVWAGTVTDSTSGALYRVDAVTGSVTTLACGLPGAIVPAAGGSLYLWENDWWMGYDLWELRDGVCQRLEPPWDGTSATVDAVAAGVDGSVLVILRERDRSGPARLVRFEGTAWSTLSELDGYYTPVMLAGDPAGGVWRMMSDFMRVERFDGTGWSVIVPAPGATEFGLWPAPDGSMWFVGAAGIERLIPTWDDPGRAPGA
jgi:hypothetical protein